MREVRLFLAPSLYDANPHLVDGVRRNGVAVERFDHVSSDYGAAVAAHNAALAAAGATDAASRSFLCVAFEDTKTGVESALAAGMCVIGVAGNNIEVERLSSRGAHAVATSVSDVLESFGVRNYYQVQYLPYAIHLHHLAETKVGYPVSLLDTLRGRFTDEGVALDPHGSRFIPREILGVRPGSLADVYINNLGWPQDSITTFRLNSRDLERDIIRFFARLYQHDELRGFITSGGTEGNFTGLWWNRDHLVHESGGAAPVLLTSEQTHYSISKAAQQLAIEGRLVPTLRTGEIDCQVFGRILDELAESAPERPVLVNVNAGTTQTGAVDDLPRVHELLTEKVAARGGHFGIHVDAALMGAVLPIIQPWGDVDLFERFGVHTLAISGHKFFGSTAICGVCLTSKAFLTACFERRDVSVAYLTGLHDITPSGSRSGFNALSFHNTLCGLYLHTDASRLRRLVQQCYDNHAYFRRGITAVVGERQVIAPEHSLSLCFPRPSAELMARYHLMPVSMPEFLEGDLEYAGVCVLVNVDREMIDEFCSAYARDRAGDGTRQPAIS
ncbi:MAG: hypothetical protein GY913_08560 [Proteobacteria bacterium]|nr:hypothetical protein [Pseudomonadota bacterium]MCP4916962.1 hypothetical protein [Pseudomonadota bacterium]